MVLAMSRPWKHPKTGIYWLRKRVPTKVAAIIGRSIVTKSLETRDPEEAKRKFADALADLTSQWASIGAHKRPITDREAHFLAKAIEKDWLEKFRDNPSEQLWWHTEIYCGMWGAKYPRAETPARPGEPGTMPVDNVFWHSMRSGCMELASDLLKENNFDDDEWSLLKTARAVSDAIQRACVALAREERGIYEPGGAPAGLGELARDSAAPSATGMPVRNQHVATGAAHSASPPAVGIPALSRRGGTSVSLVGLVEDWWLEAKATGRKPSTYDSYRNTFANFRAFLGHDDAGRIGRQEVISFKDHRLSAPSRRTGKQVSAKTVKDTDLTALRVVFGWAETNGKIASNPASGVSIRLAKKAKLRSKGFTEGEAKAILSAAMKHRRGSEAPKTFAAKRWIPWLCAFTGARVGELAQLRKQDVFQRNGHWIIRITPEAGTVKTNEAREAVLHAQLIELGFPEFAAAAADGYLFLSPADDGSVRGPLQGLKNRLAEFSRKIVSDPNVAPNHGWRHRFKTIGMEAGIPTRVLDAIQGHAPRSVSDSYGDVTIKTIAVEIAKFPSFDLQEPPKSLE